MKTISILHPSPRKFPDVERKGRILLEAISENEKEESILSILKKRK